MSGAATLFVSFLILYRSESAVKWFAAMMFCIATWAIAYSMELACHTLEQMLMWINVEYIGISFLPAMWILFVIHFIGKSEWSNAANRIVIMSLPVATLLLVWTNSMHHLHYKDAYLDATGPFPLLGIQPGPWYYVNTAYFYFLLATGIVLLIGKFRNADVAFRRQIRAILFGACLPWAVNVAYLVGLRPVGHIDLTPFTFIATSASIGYGLFRYRLFNVIPLAREKVIEAIQEGILVLDTQNRVVDMNPAMREFLPPYLTEIIGEPFSDILSEHDQLHTLVNEGRPTRTELEINDRFYEVAVTHLLNEKRVHSGMILIFWDVTDRRNATEKIEHQAQQLSDLNHLKDRLFSIVAHDLRGPIASLTALLDMAENSRLSPEEFKTMLTTLSRNVGYASATLENLLYWSMSQLEGFSVNPRRFELAPMVLDKLVLYEKRAADKAITLENKIRPGIFLFADADMIGIVLRNLVSNATKFCKRNDVIAVTAEENGDTITVCVSDTGCGMDAEKIGKLFGAEVVTSPGTLNEKGTGMGLKLCKEFVEKNAGRFWLESHPGKGSKFYFRLKKAG